MRSKLTMTGAVGCAALAALLLAREAGAGGAAGAMTPVALAVLGVAAAAAARSAARPWRGPELVSFRRDGAAVCEPAEAEIVRSAAQLRGTLGGAGYVHPSRLAISTGAWTAAAAFAGAAAVEPWRRAAVILGGVAAVLSLVAARYPACAFFYREATGGRILVHPRDVLPRLAGVCALAAGPPRSPGAECGPDSPGGWVASLTGSENGAKPPRHSPDLGP